MLLPRESAHSLITPEVQKYIYFGFDWPKGLQIGLKEEPEYIQFILYRDNFITFDGEDHVRITAMVKEMMEKLRANGVPIFLEIKAAKGEQSA